MSDGGGVPLPTGVTLPMLIASSPIPLVPIVPTGSAGWTGLRDGTVGAKNFRSYRSPDTIGPGGNIRGGAVLHDQ